MNSTAKTKEFRNWVILLSVLPLCANPLVPMTSLATSALIMWLVYAAIAWTLGSRIIGLALFGWVLSQLFAAPKVDSNPEHDILEMTFMAVLGTLGGFALGAILEGEESSIQEITSDQTEQVHEERESVAVEVGRNAQVQLSRTPGE